MRFQSICNPFPVLRKFQLVRPLILHCMDQDHSSKEALILEILASTGPQTMEQAIAKLPELGWNEVFNAVDNLSRRGEIILRRQGFEYEITSASSIGLYVSDTGKDVDAGGGGLLES